MTQPVTAPLRNKPMPRTVPALGVAMLGFFVVALDAQVVNVALPDIRSSLGGGLSGLQWVVTIYTLTFSALLLFAGTVSDRIGARKAYGTGMVLFVVASSACGLAPTLPALIGARLVQGVGAALITPTSLALIREAYTDATKRARAIALWAMGGSVAAAAGPVVGGALTQVNWRLIFFLNLPVGAGALVLLTRVAVSPRRPHPLDTVGQVSAILALGSTTFAVIEGGSRGFGDPLILAAVVVAVLAGVVFVQAQRRGGHPMVPLHLFRAPVVIVTLIVAFVSMAAFYGVVFAQSLYFQQQRGASALATGLLFLPMTGLVAALNPLVARIAERFGRLLPIIGGQLAMVAGLALLAVLPAGAPLWTVAVAMVPVGVGGSFTVPPVTSLLLEAVPAEAAGTASGVLNTARQMGGSLGARLRRRTGHRTGVPVRAAYRRPHCRRPSRGDHRGHAALAPGMSTPISRRTFGRTTAVGLIGLASALAGCTSAHQPPTTPTTTTGRRPDVSSQAPARVLLAYFSRAGENYWNGGRRTLAKGNTAVLADMIGSRVDCDTYRIEEADAYPTSYDQTVARNVTEERADTRPAIAGALPDLGAYDVVLLGSPVWNVQAPMIMSTFTDNVDLTGKTVLPFVTYAVSGIGSVESDYRAALKGVTVRTGLAVRGEQVADAGTRLDSWLRTAALLS